MTAVPTVVLRYLPGKACCSQAQEPQQSLTVYGTAGEIRSHFWSVSVPPAKAQGRKYLRSPGKQKTPPLPPRPQEVTVQRRHWSIPRGWQLSSAMAEPKAQGRSGVRWMRGLPSPPSVQRAAGSRGALPPAICRGTPAPAASAPAGGDPAAAPRAPSPAHPSGAHHLGGSRGTPKRHRGAARHTGSPATQLGPRRATGLCLHRALTQEPLSIVRSSQAHWKKQGQGQMGWDGAGWR